MFRIRQIANVATPSHRRALRRSMSMLRRRLPGVPIAEVEGMSAKLHDPAGHGFGAVLIVAEDLRDRLLGFAMMSYDVELRFGWLDYLVADDRHRVGGVGDALYQRVRELAVQLGALALLFECPSDDAAHLSEPKYLPKNAARLRFYERLGARPLIGNDYQRPIWPGQKDLPLLVFDDVAQRGAPPRALVQGAVRAVLERKYEHLCPPEYVDAVVRSFTADPVKVRAPRYRRVEVLRRAASERVVTLVVADRHSIHHVRERGYVESPVRIKAILEAITKSGLFVRVEPREHSDKLLREVHAPELVDYLKATCAAAKGSTPIYPYVFPVRNVARQPKDLTYAAGYWCIDTFTPIHRNAYRAARRAVDCALTAADAILDGQPIAYALVRPPGHHAERRVFGGFCYFNNAAVAAQALAKHGKTAIVDIDYHHGNGQQNIFYARRDVLTVSIHAHPKIAYPFFTGFEDEIGEDDGRGFNLNIPLPERLNGRSYRRALRDAIERVTEFDPEYLVVCLGLDTAKLDPTGTWSLDRDDFERNGRILGQLRRPTLVIQEGGYRAAAIGGHARAFFEGLVDGIRPSLRSARSIKKA